jgi:hypothetical protein
MSIVGLAAFGSSCSSAAALAPQPPHRTGIPAVDRVIDAVEAGDAEALRGLIRFAAFPCTTTEGPGGAPKCLESEPEGTPVEALPILGPEGGHIRRADIGSWAIEAGMKLYAVYRVRSSAFSDTFYPAGEYGVAFRASPEGSLAIYQVSEAGIVRVDYRYGFSMEDALGVDPGDIILGPLE